MCVRENVFDMVLFVWLTQGIGFHSHDDHSDHHDVYREDGTIVIEPYIWKMLCATLTVWIFFVLQITLRWISNIVRKRQAVRKVTYLSISM